MVTLTFYGGIDGIGGNQILLEDDGTRVWLDFGMSFGKRGEFYEEFLQPRDSGGLNDFLKMGLIPKLDGVYREDCIRPIGLDVALDEASNEYKKYVDASFWDLGLKNYERVKEEDGEPWIDGVLLTHAHLDHCNYISLLHEEVPIYCSPLTHRTLEVITKLGGAGSSSELAEVKRRKFKLTSRGYFPGGLDTDREEPCKRNIVDLEPYEWLKVGSLKVKPLPVDHSLLGALAYLIETSEGKTILYSGDFRFHGLWSEWTDRFKEEVEDLAPDVMIMEGTRVDEDEKHEEKKVQDECEEYVKRANELALVGFAWKDLTRFLTLREVAKRTDKTLVVSPKLAYLAHQLSGMEGLELSKLLEEGEVGVYVRRQGTMCYSPNDYTKSKFTAGLLADWERDPREVDLTHLEDGVRASDVKDNPSDYTLHLDFYRLNELVDLDPPPGSVYIRAQSEPFNEEMEITEERLENWLKKFKLKGPLHAHASGHASRPELEELVKLVKPKELIPIHTEHPEMFRELHDHVKIIGERGQVIQV